MIGPLELVQNYEKAAKELIANGKTEAAGKELKKAISAILDQQDNFDPDEFPGLVKTIENIFDDFLKIGDFSGSYDSLVLLNAFSSDKRRVGDKFTVWLKEVPKVIAEQFEPRISKLGQKNQFIRQAWESYKTNQLSPAKPQEIEIKKPQEQAQEVKQLQSSQIAAPISQERKIETVPQPNISSSQPIQPQMDSVIKLKLTIASTEISRGNYENAYVLLSDILKADPNNLEAKKMLEEVQAKRNQLEQEKAITNLINSAEPTSDDEREVLKLYFSKNFREANDLVTKLLVKERNNARLWYLKSQIVKKLGDEKTSQNFESFAKRLDPKIQESKLAQTIKSFQ